MKNNSLEIHEKSELNIIKISKDIIYLKLWFSPEPEFIASLPENVTKLYICRGGKDIVYNFPNHLTHLMLPPEYNAQLNNLPNLKVLIIGYCYTKKLNLPETLEELYFNSYFNSSNGGISLECFGEFPVLKNIPVSLHTLQLPVEINIANDTLEPVLTMFNNWEDSAYKKLSNLTSLKLICYYDAICDSSIRERDYFLKLKELIKYSHNIKYGEYKCKYEFTRN
jgi:hypothetical protein